MVQKDMSNNIEVRPVIAPIVATDNTPLVGAIIDHNDFNSVTYVINTGTLADADATFAVSIKDSNASDMTGEAAVDPIYLIGTTALAGFTFADDGECRKIGYKGPKRYSRITITPANNTGNAPLGAICILGNPRKQPRSSQG